MNHALIPHTALQCLLHSSWFCKCFFISVLQVAYNYHKKKDPVFCDKTVLDHWVCPSRSSLGDDVTITSVGSQAELWETTSQAKHNLSNPSSAATGVWLAMFLCTSKNMLGLALLQPFLLFMVLVGLSIMVLSLPVRETDKVQAGQSAEWFSLPQRSTPRRAHGWVQGNMEGLCWN